MVWLTDLADACRRSGLTVIEQPGWRDRGHGPLMGVQAIIAHHTATPASATGDYPSLRVVRDGRAGLDGPLAQIGLGRSGVVYVIAAGKCYHAGVTHQTWQGNFYAIGIEAEHPGTGPWPQVQYDAYVRLARALAAHYRVPASRVLGHKEIAKPAGRKSDPNFDMTVFRAALAQTEEDDLTPDEAVAAARTAMAQMFDEAANRSTPTGRALGDDLAKILGIVRPDPVAMAAQLAPLLGNTDQATVEAALRNVLGSLSKES